MTVNGAGRRRPATATARFGSSRRESHDASAFYGRFTAPAITTDAAIARPDDWPRRDEIIHGDIRDHPGTLAPASVALMVTSPPYYSGKDYELAVGQGHVPASYEKYLDMLHGVFAACVTALEPGGRMAVNVANLGRKPYRSLSRDVIDIFEDLKLLLRGEIVWLKARGAGGSCAWGTYQRPGDPVLRDVTERIVVASKHRFDRAPSPRARALAGHPSESSISRDEFLAATTDVWEIPPESATRVNHPAPFPVALPQRLMELFTYRGDLVIDPFMGSGSTAVAALRTERHYLGYDTDAAYVVAARTRVALERERLAGLATKGHEPPRVVLPAGPELSDAAEGFQARAAREGRRALELAEWAITEGAGFVITDRSKRLGAGVAVTFVAHDDRGDEWLFDVSGAFTSTRAGLCRADTLFKALGKATVLHRTRPPTPLVLLTTDRPGPNTAGGQALRAVVAQDPANAPIYDVIELRCAEDIVRLRGYSQGWRNR